MHFIDADGGSMRISAAEGGKPAAILPVKAVQIPYAGAGPGAGFAVKGIGIGFLYENTVGSGHGIFINVAVVQPGYVRLPYPIGPACAG